MDIINVDGVPFKLALNGDNFYISATSQNAQVNTSPVVVSFDPPIAPTVDAGALYQAIKAKLA